jgi:hypothetical protein
MIKERDDNFGDAYQGVSNRVLYTGGQIELERPRLSQTPHLARQLTNLLRTHHYVNMVVVGATKDQKKLTLNMPPTVPPTDGTMGVSLVAECTTQEEFFTRMAGITCGHGCMQLTNGGSFRRPYNGATLMNWFKKNLQLYAAGKKMVTQNGTGGLARFLGKEEVGPEERAVHQWFMLVEGRYSEDEGYPYDSDLDQCWYDLWSAIDEKASAGTSATATERKRKEAARVAGVSLRSKVLNRTALEQACGAAQHEEKVAATIWLQVMCTVACLVKFCVAATPYCCICRAPLQVSKTLTVVHIPVHRHSWPSEGVQQTLKVMRICMKRWRCSRRSMHVALMLL